MNVVAALPPSLVALACSCTLQAHAATSELDAPGGRVRVAQAEGNSDHRPPPSGELREMRDLEEVVVTAQKRQERLRDVPISISVESGLELDRSSFQGVTDVLTQIPGVVAKKGVQGGGTQIGIRGVAAAAAASTGSSPIGYYLDSVPLGFVRSAETPDPGAYDLQRVEILRGPQGTLYGAGGMNGLVRILTHDADLSDFELKTRATFSDTRDGGSSYRADAAINVPVVEGKLALRGVVGYADLGGWVDSSSANDINDGELLSYRLKLNAQPTDDLTIGLSAWSSRDDYGAPSVSDEQRRTVAAASQPFSADFDSLSLTISAQGAAWQFSSMSSYIDYDNLGVLDLTSLGATGVRLETGFGSRVLAQEFVLNSASESAWRWSTGLFYREAKDRQTSAFLQSGAIKAHLFDESESYAAFGQLGRRFLADRFEWTVGLRYFSDEVSHRGNPPTTTNTLPKDADRFHATSPRFVLQWYPNSNVAVYASYAEGFRSGFPQNVAIRTAFPEFPPVEPDTLHNYEVGTKGDFLDGRLSLEAAVFFMDWTDVQVNLTVPYINNATITTPVNGDSASGWGIDFGFKAMPSDGLEFGANVSWNDLTLDKNVLVGSTVIMAAGDRLNFSSEYTAAAFAGYTFPIGSRFTGKLAADLSYSSEQINRLFPPPVYISEGTSFTNLRTSFALRSNDAWSVTIFADNLTDDNGRFPGVGRNVADWYPRMRPRTLGVQFDYHY